MKGKRLPMLLLALVGAAWFVGGVRQVRAMRAGGLIERPATVDPAAAEVATPPAQTAAALIALRSTEANAEEALVARQDVEVKLHAVRSLILLLATTSDCHTGEAPLLDTLRVDVVAKTVGEAISQLRSAGVQVVFDVEIDESAAISMDLRGGLARAALDWLASAAALTLRVEEGVAHLSPKP